MENIAWSEVLDQEDRDSQNHHPYSYNLLTGDGRDNMIFSSPGNIGDSHYNGMVQFDSLRNEEGISVGDSRKRAAPFLLEPRMPRLMLNENRNGMLSFQYAQENKAVLSSSMEHGQQLVDCAVDNSVMVDEMNMNSTSNLIKNNYYAPELMNGSNMNEECDLINDQSINHYNLEAEATNDIGLPDLGNLNVMTTWSELDEWFGSSSGLIRGLDDM